MLTAFHDAQLVKIRVDGREGGTLSLKPGSNLTIGRWVLVSSPTRPLPHLTPARTRCGSVQLFGCGPARGAGRESGRTRACACACVRGGRRVFAVLLPELPAADHFRFATTGPTTATCSSSSRCEGARQGGPGRWLCNVARRSMRRIARRRGSCRPLLAARPILTSQRSAVAVLRFAAVPRTTHQPTPHPPTPTPHQVVSRSHASLLVDENGKVQFKSLSNNETLVNGQGISKNQMVRPAPRATRRALRAVCRARRAPCAVCRVPCAVCRAPYPAATAPRRAVPCTAHRPPLTAYRSPLTQLPPHPPTHPPRHLRGTYCERCR